jgi:two-component system OmpR family sensor kinase/two-component system sensor histidine kinase BaeS
MKPRLFWSMLLAFVLVIVLGVCGMLGFFGLAVAGYWQPSELPRDFRGPQHAYVEELADYYLAHERSWAGVDRRLRDEPFGPISLLGYALADAEGRVIVSNDRSLKAGQPLSAELLARGTPVVARGARVGTFVLLQPGNDFRPTPRPASQMPSFFWSVLRGFLFAGLGLGGVLLALAAFFAQRLSRPIRGITAASQALAAGQLDVQAPGARVRELDDLAHSFNAMARALAQADRQRRQMTADVAHELRTPLSIIKGRLEGLQDGVYSATPEEIERLLSATALLERLIEDLRLLALAEAGQLALYTEQLEPRDMLQDAAQAFSGQAAEQAVALRVAAPADLPLVEADPQRMAQVFANLIANALRYTPAGGNITLEATTDHRPPTTDHRPQKNQDSNLRSSNDLSVVGHQSSVVFRVTDTGQGIAPQDLPHVFDRFYRADRSRTRGSGGAGLGLAIAKQIVVAHGGAIWAESELGQGTTINIALPVADAGATIPAIDEPEQRAIGE